MASLFASHQLFFYQKLMFPFLFLGGEIVSTFGHPELVKLGECKVIEEVMIGEDKVCAYLYISVILKILSIQDVHAAICDEHSKYLH